MTLLMQMGYDFEDGRFAPDPSLRIAGQPSFARPSDEAGDSAATLRHPEWASLRARFQAIHALQRTLAEQSAMPALVGNFLEASESVLSACRAGVAVNPVYSANLKAGSAMNAPSPFFPHAATEECHD